MARPLGSRLCADQCGVHRRFWFCVCGVDLRCQIRKKRRLKRVHILNLRIVHMMQCVMCADRCAHHSKKLGECIEHDKHHPIKCGLREIC